MGLFTFRYIHSSCTRLEVILIALSWVCSLVCASRPRSVEAAAQHSNLEAANGPPPTKFSLRVLADTSIGVSTPPGGPKPQSQKPQSDSISDSSQEEQRRLNSDYMKAFLVDSIDKVKERVLARQQKADDQKAKSGAACKWVPKSQRKSGSLVQLGDGSQNRQTPKSDKVESNDDWEKAKKYEELQVAAVLKDIRKNNNPHWLQSDVVVMTSYLEWGGELGPMLASSAARGNVDMFIGKTIGKDGDYVLQPDPEHANAMNAWHEAKVPVCFYAAQLSANPLRNYAADKINTWRDAPKRAKGGRILLEDHVSLLTQMFYNQAFVDAVMRVIDDGHQFGILTCRGQSFIDDVRGGILEPATQQYLLDRMEDGSFVVFSTEGTIKVTNAKSKKMEGLEEDIGLKKRVAKFLKLEKELMKVGAVGHGLQLRTEDAACKIKPKCLPF